MQKKEMAGLMVIAAGCLWGVIGLFSRKLSAVGFDAVQITALRSLVRIQPHGTERPLAAHLAVLPLGDLPGTVHLAHSAVCDLSPHH